MDEKDKQILKLIKGNARMTYQEIANKLGISRVAIKKRVTKLEQDGVIRQYNTYIKRDDEVTIFIDIITTPDGYQRVLDYVANRTDFVRQIFSTYKENHIHIVAVSDSSENIKYLAKIIRAACIDDIVEYHARIVREVIKDVYGGINKYESGAKSDTNTDS